MKATLPSALQAQIETARTALVAKKAAPGSMN
jgi:hypothetical protein